MDRGVSAPIHPNAKGSASNMSIYQPTLEYYVYAYLRQDGTPYYIGKGKGNRAYKGIHNVSIPKDMSKIVIMEANLTEVGAVGLERFYIRWYGRKDNMGILHNKTDGGEGTNGLKLSDDHKKKISVVHKGKIVSEKTRYKMSIANSGKKHKQETKDKISDCHLGKKHKQETKDKIGNSRKGKSLSFETKQKISLSLKGRKHTEITRKKMLGRTVSLETREKISNFWKSKRHNMMDNIV